jgi:site-specific DNA-methyltransferase (adenine-specific)
MYWKVITPEAAHKAFSGFGALFVAKPDEVHTGSYISFRVESQLEAESLLSYLQTRFANHMLSIRKISQHINESVCKWIPLVPLDRVWTDGAVCEHLEIDRSLYP